MGCDASIDLSVNCVQRLLKGTKRSGEQKEVRSKEFTTKIQL